MVLADVPPITLFHFTSFSHIVFKQDENAYIFHIHCHFYIHIPHIGTHDPIYPIYHPSITCNLYNSLECSGIFIEPRMHW